MNIVNHSLLRQSTRKATQSGDTTALSHLGINKEDSTLNHSELPSNKSASASQAKDIPKSNLVNEKKDTVNNSDKNLLCLLGTLLNSIELQKNEGFMEESRNVDMGGDVDSINSNEEGA